MVWLWFGIADVVALCCLGSVVRDCRVGVRVRVVLVPPVCSPSVRAGDVAVVVNIRVWVRVIAGARVVIWVHVVVGRAILYTIDVLLCGDNDYDVRAFVWLFAYYIYMGALLQGGGACFCC